MGLRITGAPGAVVAAVILRLTADMAMLPLLLVLGKEPIMKVEMGMQYLLFLVKKFL